MTSMASATARNGQTSTPVTDLDLACRPTAMAISVAPPPGARIGLKTTLRATDIASARLRSISLRMSFEGPRSKIVHAFGETHSERNVKYLIKNILKGKERKLVKCPLTRHQFFRYRKAHIRCRYRPLACLPRGLRWSRQRRGQYDCYLIFAHAG
jgi:hypothetical protein